MIKNNAPYIIAETAFHHEGDEEFLIKLINEAKIIDVDAIKFHLLLNVDDFMIAEHEAFDLVKQWCFSTKVWDQVINSAEEIDIILLCNDNMSVDYAIGKGKKIKAIEIHATGVNDIFLLEKASQFHGTVILGTGGSSLDEIDFAINFLKEKGKKDIFLMHGFQNYPTDYKDIKLMRMKLLSELFDLPVGYADHTDPEDEKNEYISCLAIANGFNVLEKHFTPVFGEKRIDSQSAVSIKQLKKIKKLSSIVWETIGINKPLKLSDAELKYGNTGPMKKAIVAKKDIHKGDLISLDNIAFKRTNNSSSIKQIELSKIINNKTNRLIKKDEIIDFNNVNYTFKKNDFSQFRNTQR